MSVQIKHKNPDAIKNVLSNIKKFAEKEVAVGFPRGKSQAYPEGDSVPEVAAKNVFGEGVIQRDFMSLADIYIKDDSTIKESLKEANHEANHPQGNAQIVIERLLEAVGLKGQTLIQQAILEGGWEPNSDKPMSASLRAAVEKSWGKNIPGGMSYLEAKRQFRGSDKPLIDSAHMLNSVTYVVREKK